jgi:hypothetical protein
VRFGSWWALQWGRDRLLEFGLHVETRQRLTNTGVRFGPYIDLHLPFVTVSLGRNPIHAGELELLRSTARGGIA